MFEDPRMHHAYCMYLLRRAVDLHIYVNVKSLLGIVFSGQKSNQMLNILKLFILFRLTEDQWSEKYKRGALYQESWAIQLRRCGIYQDSWAI